jgi:hypothetical protein
MHIVRGRPFQLYVLWYMRHVSFHGSTRVIEFAFLTPDG